MNDQNQLISFQDLPSTYKSEVEFILQSKFDPIKKMYSQLHFMYLKCPIICNENAEEQIKNLMQKFFEDIKLITYEIKNIVNESTSTVLNSLVICSEENCLIIEFIKADLLEKILDNKNLSKIDVKEQNVKEEINNFLVNYSIIQSKHFKTINPIISFYIRRYFYPTNFFKNSDFFIFNQHQNFEKGIKQKVTNYLSKDKNQIETTFPSFEKQILEEIENEKKENENENEIFDESDFINLRCIGNSGARVYLVIHIKTLFIFAMRVSEYKKREIEFYTKYSNRCLLKFYGFVKPKKPKIENVQSGIFEFMSNGDLMNFINNKKIDDSFIFMTINRLFQGINFLHSNNFIHRDLNPLNILVDHDFVPFISDIEYARDDIRSISTITGDIGNFQYASPEQYNGKVKLTFSTDIYSFGQIIYFLLEKKDMIYNCNIDDLLRIIKSIPQMNNASKEIQEFVQNLVFENPEKRLDNMRIKYFIYDQLKNQISSLLLTENNFLEQYLYEYIVFNYQLIPDDYNFFGELCYNNKDYKKALEYYQISAEKNNAKAFFSIGFLYFHGYGVVKDWFKAKEYFEKSAEQDYSRSYMFLANIYCEGDDSIKDINKAIKCYEKVGPVDPMAYNMLGEMYFDNRYKIRNFEIARNYFLKSAEKEVSRSYNFLGAIYYDGLCVEQDFVKAKEYFDKGEKCGESMSLFYLGKFYYEGNLVEKNINKAIEYFNKAAKKGYSPAHFYLGNIYQYPSHIPIDISKAIYHYEKAGNDGFPDAWNNIALIYYFGEGVKKDIEKSIQYFEKAANKGNSVAIYNLGDIYYNGDGVKKNYIKAKKYFELSAKLNNIESIFYLGNLYFKGKGVDQNYNKAFDLFNSITYHPSSLYYLGIIYLNGLGVNIDISKAIESFDKCSKMDEYSYETLNEDETIYSSVTQKNNYVYPSLNSLGLIYLYQFENEIQKAEFFIKKAGCSCFYFAKNNYGLFSQFFLNKIENAIELYKTSSHEGNFALAEYNIGYINEKVNNDMNSAIEHYKKALNFIDLPLKYHDTLIEDEQFDISKSFIDCFINLKLTVFYLSQSNLNSSQHYFLNALFKPLFKYLFQNEIDSLSFQFKLPFNLKDFFLNFPLFNLSNQKNFKYDISNSEWSIFHHSRSNNNLKFNSIIINRQKDQNFQPVSAKDKIKDKFFDEISIPDDLIERIQNNYNHENNLNDFISNIFKAMNCQNIFEIIDDDILDSDIDSDINVFRFNSEENEIERFIKYPKYLKDFFFKNTDDLKNEIIDIINEMNEMLYKPPYQILFGKINLNKNDQ